MYTHSPIKTFEKESLNVRFMKWIPIASLGTIYNEKMRSVFSKKEQSTKSQSQFDCFFSKIPQNYKKTLGQECVLLVVSDSFGLLFVDFYKEGIIRMDSSISILSFDLTFASAGTVKQTLIVHGNKSGVVDFNFCDSDLRDAHHSVSKAHTGSVSCLQFSRLSDGRLKCASGSYDRYINLYRINNFGKKEFDPAKDITLYAKLKYAPLTRHKYRIIQLNFSFHNFDQLLNVCDKHATVQVRLAHQIWDSTFEDKADRRLYNIRGHRGFISSAAFSLQAPNMVITGSDDQTVKVWNLLEIKNSKPPNKKKQKLLAKPEEEEEDEEDVEEEEPSEEEKEPETQAQPPEPAEEAAEQPKTGEEQA